MIMIKKSEIVTEVLTGTEEELLKYFKEKYNLVENTTVTVQQSVPDDNFPKSEIKFVDRLSESTARNDYPTPPPNTSSSVFGNKVTTGYSNLFGGTSWGA